ncbi:c-type cytochrome biogenesis protein CcmI [Vibrio sp. 10N.261.55.A7]|uniref:c-type cytochrome biogenesis protein CcmI n=1 Tax=Vibrio sp. 10N.261.55.A7 TaxID=1880851 RepID=UPI000C820737|nr:c-type cytochrome biogenesis protein CcmI [Vibrio sp. 10N.261.55.A7]PMK01900.1 c-type cytochrome biogenesis protein CcmI [Vibrio sp. 10N.261.55.A7]
MTLFWVASVLLVLFACLMIVLPVIKKRTNDDQSARDELNKAFFKDRLTELEEEDKEGLVDDQQELISDLKQSLLDDVPSDAQVGKETPISPMLFVVPSILLVIALSYATYAKFGAMDKVIEWNEVTSNLPELSKKLMNPEGVMLTDDEMDDLTLGLRTRLHADPQDMTGWMLLGRIALANRDVETALGAMKRAYRLDTSDQDAQLGFAQALMMSPDETDQNRARSMLNNLIQQDYVDLRVFSLLAFDSFERNDYASAVKYWSIMQKMIGPEDSRFEMLSRSIESAQKRMGITTEPATSQSLESAHGEGSQQSLQGSSAAITISLSDAVNLNSGVALIVSVHSADGMPMPVAAARYPVGSFPRTVVIDDGNSMVEGRNFSDLESFIVRVRIDSDGNVSTKEGDWHGESAVTQMGESVNVVIDRQF